MERLTVHVYTVEHTHTTTGGYRIPLTIFSSPLNLKEIHILVYDFTSDCILFMTIMRN